MSKKDKFNFRHFYLQFSMTKLKKIDTEEENFIMDIIFDFQRKAFLIPVVFD